MGSAAAKKRAQLLRGKGVNDGRTVEKKQYQGKIGELGYDHAAFVPDIDGNDDDFMTSVSQEWRLIRLPIVVKHFDKKYDPVWDVDTHGLLEDSLGGCCVHGGMRSLEGTTEGMLANPIERYAAGKGSDRRDVDVHLSNALKTHIKGWYKKLLSTDNKGSMNDISFGGAEVKMLSNDGSGGDDGTSASEFMKAVLDTFDKLKLDANTANLAMWEEIFRHWSVALKAGYTLKATDADRQRFAEEIRWYVLKKAMLKPDGLRWYDWQFWSIFPELFFKFGSLRLISQEALEAQMALNNQHMQRSNGFGNVGRRLGDAVRAGAQQLAEYMRKRAANARSSVRWLWERQFVAFMAPVHEVYERLEERKAAGTGIPYQGEPGSRSYVEAHITFESISPTALKLISRARAAGADRNSLKALACLVAAHRKDLDEDVKRCAAMLPEDRRKELLRARKRRWKQAKGEGSGKALLHAEARLGQAHKGLVLRMFGAGGMFPMCTGRARRELRAS